LDRSPGLHDADGRSVRHLAGGGVVAGNGYGDQEAVPRDVVEYRCWGCLRAVHRGVLVGEGVVQGVGFSTDGDHALECGVEV